MKYIVDIGGERHEVTVDGGTVSVGGAAFPAHLEQLDGTPVLLVSVGTSVHRIIARRSDGRGAYALSVDGFAFAAEALDERTRAIRDITAASAGGARAAHVSAPMPGLIVKVNVAPGEVVKAGQGLIVMEAMKMENELRASAPGRVKSVVVAPGTAVEKGALLVEIEPIADQPAA